MPCPHFQITIRNRSGSSAVAGAAYNAGENLFSEYEKKIKYFAYKKPEVYYSEILLPPNAPKEYLDRETLWNSAESVEKSWNSQLARNIVAALPKEIPREQFPEMVRKFCNEQFVSKGMCCDFSIHDKGDGNPHVHILLSLRAIDENGKWMPKCRKEYDLDDYGNRIILPSGEYKSHRVDTTDWNKKENSEIWRDAWAKIQNEYFEKNGIDERIDLRSYEKQGIDKLPTVHLGPYASMLEKEGTATELGEFNRAIEQHNSKKSALLEMLKELVEWVKEIAELIQKLKTNLNRQPTLPEILLDYLDIRKEGRSSWGYYAQRECNIKDLQEVSDAIYVLDSLRLKTVEELQNVIFAAEEKAQAKADVNEMKQIISHLHDVQDNAKVYETSKSGKGFYYNQYKTKHQAEIDKYLKGIKYLKIHNIYPFANIEAYEGSLRNLKSKYESFGKDVLDKQSDSFKKLKKISKCVTTVLGEMGIAESEAGKAKTVKDDYDIPALAKDNERASVLEKLNAAKQQTTDKSKTPARNKSGQEL